MRKLNSIKFKVLIPWLFLILLLITMLIGKNHQNNRLNILNNHLELHYKLRRITEEICSTYSSIWIKFLKYKGTIREEFIKRNIIASDKFVSIKIEEYLKVYEGFDAEIKSKEFITEFNNKRIDLWVMITHYLTNSNGEYINDIELNDISYRLSQMNYDLESAISFHNSQILSLSKDKDNRIILSDNILIFVISSIIFIILILIIYQSLLITTPLIQLQKWALKVHSGEKYLPIKINNKDEIGSLADILNDMVLELDKNYRDIEKSNNKLKVAYSSIQDIVNERTLELTMKNQDIEDFCCSISSDLRTPLRAIREFLKIVYDENNHKLDNESLRLFNIAKKNVNKMDDIIEDLIKYSNVATYQLDYVKVNVNDLVNKKFIELSDRYKKNNIDFYLDDLPDLNCDFTLFKILWENILDNAIKFTSHLNSPKIKVYGDHDHSFVHYTIEDNGIGFDSSKSNDIFSLFSKLHYKEDYEGNGIGLALVKKIVDKHGGFITLQSKVNIGTSIVLSFPRGDLIYE